MQLKPLIFKAFVIQHGENFIVLPLQREYLHTMALVGENRQQTRTNQGEFCIFFVRHSL